MTQAAFGKVVEIKKVRTQQVARIMVELPVEAFADLVAMLDERDVLVTIAPAELNGKTPYGVFRASGIEAAGQPAVTTASATAENHKPASWSEYGPLCRLAIQWSSDAEFEQWIRRTFVVTSTPAEWIKAVCGVDSRKDIDGGGDATARFHRDIRAPFMAWRARNAAAAT